MEREGVQVRGEMGALRIIRDKKTKEVTTMATGAEVLMECGPGEEYVELEGMTHADALEKAVKKAGAGPSRPLGKFYIHDDRIEADPATPPAPIPTIADRIRENRKKRGKAIDAPVTLEELEAVEKSLSGD